MRPGSDFGIPGARAHHGRAGAADGARRGGDRRALAMKRVALIAHCLINQNAKVEGGALTPAVWEPVVDLLARARVGDPPDAVPGAGIRAVRGASGACTSSTTRRSSAATAGGSRS